MLLMVHFLSHPLQVDYMIDDLRREFLGLDPYRSGCVDREEFQEILTELCVQLSPPELESLATKFQVPDGRLEMRTYCCCC